MRRCRGLTRFAVAAGALFVAAPAAALVTEPNGLVVPVNSGPGETQIYTLFQNQGETIDWQNDAVDIPETFSPLCEFTAYFLMRESAAHLPFGWYNVDPNAVTAPTGADIHEIVGCNTPVGAVITSTNIKSDPAYAGGLIGFALARSSSVGACVTYASPGNIVEIHYTEKKWNNKYQNNPATPWITALIYDSKKAQNAFYIAFEDWATTPTAWSNDGDFNDFVVLVTGITCPGGGEPCDTGQQGACGPGVTHCVNGQIQCEGLFPPAAQETCDGLDEDCNGLIDDGFLCPPEQICLNGTCVAKCASGEFECPAGKECNAMGYCVDPACIPVTCQADEICVAGQCKGACDGVTCPKGQICQLGACVDPCSAITCPQDQVCVNGGCRAKCDCLPCATGLECQASSGLCVPTGCGALACAANEICENGACVNACTGAVCPAGQKCENGDCIDDPAADAGTAGTGGTPFVDGGFSGTSGSGGSSGTGNTGATASGGSSGSGGSSEDPGDFGGSDESSGCGCRTTRGGDAGLAALAVLGVGMSVRRRRRAAR